MYVHTKWFVASRAVVALRINPKICEAYFSKCTTSGEPPVGSRSHCYSYFCSNKQSFCVRTSWRPCMSRLSTKNYNPGATGSLHHFMLKLFRTILNPAPFSVKSSNFSETFMSITPSTLHKPWKCMLLFRDFTLNVWITGQTDRYITFKF